MDKSPTITTLKERIGWIEDKIQWAEHTSTEFKLKLANDQTEISKLRTNVKLIEIETFLIRLKSDLISFQSTLDKQLRINEAVMKFEDSYTNVFGAYNDVIDSIHEMSSIITKHDDVSDIV